MSQIEVVQHRARFNGVAHVALTVPYGSSHDPVGMEGLSHLIEHALVSACFTSVNGVSASTGRDRTVYETTVRVEDLNAAVVALRTIFDAAQGLEWNTVLDEISVVGREISERRGDKSWMLREKVLGEFWRGTRYEHSPLGTDCSLAAIDADTMLEEYRRHYRPENSILVLGVPSGFVRSSGILSVISETLEANTAAEVGASDMPFLGPMTYMSEVQGKELSCFAWRDRAPHVVLRRPLEALAGVRIIHVPLRGGWLGVACCDSEHEAVDRMKHGLYRLNDSFHKDRMISDAIVNRFLLREMRLHSSASDVVRKRFDDIWTNVELLGSLDGYEAAASAMLGVLEELT